MTMAFRGWRTEGFLFINIFWCGCDEYHEGYEFPRHQILSAVSPVAFSQDAKE